MRPRTLTALAAAGLAVAAPVALAGQQSTTIGTGAKTCVLKPGADCRGVVHRWTVEHHGNLKKAKFTKADLRGADFRGADLRGADFRGAKLRHADLRGARLKGTRFDAPPKAGKQANGNLSQPAYGCATWPNCAGANLTLANMGGVNLTGVYFTGANLTGANLPAANLTGANFESANLAYAYSYGANLTGASLTGANLTGANLTDVIWSNTTCPNGTVTSIGC